MTSLVPKAALVTGAAKRIGRAMALDLAAQGHAVAVHFHRSEAEATAIVAEITGQGGRGIALAADLSREEDVVALVPRAAEALGMLGVLVNNASIFEYDTIGDATRESWNAHVETNLRAPFVLTQEFARQLSAPHEGVVVNLLDQRVWNPTPHFMSYTLSKSALWTLTRTSALALAPRIRVNGIGPGPVLPSARQSAAQFAHQVASLPLRRGSDLDELCVALRFILAARSMTGQMIALDGGQHLNWAPAGTMARPEE